MLYPQAGMAYAVRSALLDCYRYREVLLTLFQRELKLKYKRTFFGYLWSLFNPILNLLILSLVEHEARHGYELSKLIDTRSNGAIRFHVASLYPLLYRLEKRGWIEGRWVEKAGQRRRRYYRLTAEGRRVLAAQRRNWREFVEAIARITGVEYA